MKNKALLEEREVALINRLNDESISDDERKICHKELVDIHELLNKDEQVENSKKELELKLKNEKFNKIVGVGKDIVLPIIKGVSMAAFTVGVFKFTMDYERDDVFTSSAGKGIASLPGKLITNFIKW